MDLRTQTSLFCGVLALTIAASILLRGRLRRPQVMFAAFAADIGLFYLSQWLYQTIHSDPIAVSVKGGNVVGAGDVVAMAPTKKSGSSTAPVPLPRG